MLEVKIDYQKLQVPTYSDQYSRIPHYTDNEKDMFICTAVFRKEYMEKLKDSDELPSRSKDNMLPAFFVYESDTVPLRQQLVKALQIRNDPKFTNRIFSQTFSGSKSVHTLVYIDPEYREDVSEDFKYYWSKLGSIIFGDVKYLDIACATIGRLSRNPNGVRDNGKIQECYYFNPNATLRNWGFEKIIEKHKIDLNLERIAKAERDQKASQLYLNNKEEEMIKLENMHKKGNGSEAFNLAYDVIVNHDCPKGANYISACAALKGCGFSADLAKEMLRIASEAHPTNISRRNVEKTVSRIYST